MPVQSTQPMSLKCAGTLCGNVLKKWMLVGQKCSPGDLSAGLRFKLWERNLDGFRSQRFCFVWEAFFSDSLTTTPTDLG